MEKDNSENLILTIIEADLLEGAALIKMNAYCRVKHGKMTLKTEVQAGYKPLWNQRYELKDLKESDEISFEIMNSFLIDGCIGSTTVKAGDITRNQIISRHVYSEGKYSGTLRLKARWDYILVADNFDGMDDFEQEKPHQEEEEEISE